MSTQTLPNHVPITVAYRGGHRWVRTTEPVRLESPTGRGDRLKQRGTYLITGGAVFNVAGGATTHLVDNQGLWRQTGGA